MADPPWPNRSVRRGGKYNCMSLEDIRDLGPSVQQLANPDCCVLALWVTNDPAVVEFATSVLLPAWRFEYASTWWWLKVTSAGRPVCPTGGRHKNPYERIIIGTRQSSRVLRFEQPPPDALSLCAHGWHTKDALITVEAAPFPYNSVSATNGAPLSGVVPWRCIVSTPLRHSWKPPVHSILSDIINSVRRSGRLESCRVDEEFSDSHDVLELFARSLLRVILHSFFISKLAATFQRA